MPRKVKEAPYSEVEIAFFGAIDRLLEGKPRSLSLRSRRNVKINMTTIAIEAGYARTYLYKTKLPRVMARIRDAIKPPTQIKSTKNLVEEIRAQRNQALVDRDKAIDATRRWMQNCFRLETTIKKLETEISDLRKQQSDLRVVR